MARTTIPAELVAVNAIQGTLIADNAITAVHIATNAISGTLIADNAITSTHIAENNVTATQIAMNTITVTQVADNAITTPKISADAVTGAKIANDSIDSEHLVDGSIDTAHIGDVQVTAAKLGDNAVTLAKMASLARGSIIVGDAAGDPAALAIGSNTYVLSSDGTDIAWAANAALPLAGGTVTGNLRSASFSVGDTDSGEALNILDGGHTGHGATNTVSLASFAESVSGNSSGVWLGSMTNENTGVIGTRTASGNLGFQTYNGGWGERMRITSAGNVGIGTSSPGHGLTVSDDTGGDNADMRRITIKSQTHGVNSGFRFDSESANGTARAGGYYFQPGNTDADTYLGLTATDAAYQMVITREGNVGIGTSNPNANAKLDVNGVIRLYNASSNPTAVAGGLYYNTTDAQVKVSNGTTWVAVGGSVLPTAISSLYSWWDFSGTYSTIGSGNSTVTDASGNGYTLTENGTITTESFPSGRSGMRTGASGAANYFSSSAIPATGGAARTLFVIFYNLKTTGEVLQHIMHYGTNNTGQAFGAAYGSGGTISQHTWAGTGASISYTQGRTGTSGVAVIFSVYDGNNTGKVRLYDAGSITGSNSTAAYTPNTGTGYGIQVGSRIATSEYGDVVIGECGAYSKALTDTEMDQIAVGLLNRWV